METLSARQSADLKTIAATHKSDTSIDVSKLPLDRLHQIALNDLSKTSNREEALASLLRSYRLRGADRAETFWLQISTNTNFVAGIGRLARTQGEAREACEELVYRIQRVHHEEWSLWVSEFDEATKIEVEKAFYDRLRALIRVTPIVGARA